MIRFIAILSLLFLNLIVVSGQKGLNQSLTEILQHSSFDYASVGLSVRSVEGEEVVNIDGDKKLIPASSLKLITTLLTLEEFGEDFKFTTRVGYSGEIDRAGTLNGNIVIIGSGDPTFGSTRYGREAGWINVLAKIIKAIKDKGIRCVDGKIEVKTNVFEGQAICPSWPYSDIANYYGSGAWGLNFNENKYNLYFSAKVPEGDIATLDKVEPEIPNMHLTSEVVVKGPKTGDNAYIYGDPYNYSKIIRGSIPFSNNQFVIKGATPNPPLSFGYILEYHLNRAGVTTNGSEVSKQAIKKSDFKSLTSFKSPKVGRIVQEANYESINLYCEALLKMLGRKSKGIGSFETGLDYVEERLVEKGVPKLSFMINDGGGLSPRNSITASSFTQFLNAQYGILGQQTLEEFLPHVGHSGTVKNMMQGKQGRDQFYLKSGSMGGVLTYTGMFQVKSGKVYTVSFLCNNHSRGNRRIREQAERIFETLYLSL